MFNVVFIFLNKDIFYGILVVIGDIDGLRLQQFFIFFQDLFGFCWVIWLFNVVYSFLRQILIFVIFLEYSMVLIYFFYGWEGYNFRDF